MAVNLFYNLLMAVQLADSSRPGSFTFLNLKFVSVTSMSFSHEDRNLFVLGSEAGGVFKCSMTSRGPPLTSKCKGKDSNI